MMTEGSNFTGIWDFALEHAGEEQIELNALKSNDVFAMLLTYGVEAARLTIVQEIQGIFGAYGIAVDSRHVELIADYMVRLYNLSLRALSFSTFPCVLTYTSSRRHLMVVTSLSTGRVSLHTARLYSRLPLRQQRHSSRMQRFMAISTILRLLLAVLLLVDLQKWAPARSMY